VNWTTMTATAALAICATAYPQTAAAQSSPEVAPLQLQGRTIREIVAPDADQGAAVDSQWVYAIDNSVIAQMAKSDGAPHARWVGPERLLQHMNSCLALEGRLWCANSNYSDTPMASSVEVFDTDPLAHAQSHSLGILDEGSLVWVDRVPEGWIAGFAHYDDNGGLPFKNHAYSGVVRYDEGWRRLGGWAFPASILERLAPDAASGGALGPDGLLYIMGHDRPEMYVTARPVMGPTLIHVATIAVEAEGQAFSWDRTVDERVVYVVDRRIGRVREIEIPPVTIADRDDALPFVP